MENNSIEISTNLTTDDLKRIGFRQIRTKLVFTSILLIFFVGLIGLGILLSLLSKGDKIPLVTITPLLIPIGIFSFVLFTYIWAVTKQAKQLGNSIELTKYIFNEQGMEAESASTSVRTLWSNFLKAKEYNTDFLLYTQKNVAILIPKHFFRSDTQIIEFRSLCESRVEKQTSKE